MFGKQAANTDRNLLFGVLYLQTELIDAKQLAEVCGAWAARREGQLAGLLVERGWITSDDRCHVEKLLERGDQTLRRRRASGTGGDGQR